MSVAGLRWHITARQRANAEPREWIGGHIRVLDGLRGVAVLAVMTHHFSRVVPHVTGLTAALQRASLVGWRGVDLFFVLSGFLITGILLDAKGSAGYFKTFYIRRALRIFPLYYGVLLLAAIGLHLPAVRSFFALGRVESSLGWLCFYGNNLAMAGHRDMEIFGTMGHFWSLAVEEHFYLFWPAVVFLCSRERLVKIAVSCVAIALFLRIALAVYTGSWVAGYVLTPCRVDGLALGALLAVVVRSSLSVALVRRGAGWMMALGALVLLVAGMGGHHFAANGPIRRIFEAIEPTGYAFLFTGLMAIILSSRPQEMLRAVLEAKPLMSVGRYSYAMYILHLIFLPAFIRWFGPAQLAHLTRSRNIAAVVFCVLAISASYLIAWTSWNVYEKHFLKLKRFFTYGSPAAAATLGTGQVKGREKITSIISTGCEAAQ